jgi:CheY-specific phosphatase CheX
MGIQFFGEFLIDRWVITRGQLLEALELQQYRNTKFGALAVEQGFIDRRQAEQINARQRSEDKRFGDLAVEMGLMTAEQVRTVLILQKNNYLYLGESLLELGHITEDILERELAIFEGEQARYAQEAVPVPEGVGGAAVVSASVDLTRKMFLRVVGTLVKVGDGRLGEPPPAEPGVPRPDYHLTVSVPLASSTPVRYLLSVSSEVAVQIASKILGQDATRESEALVEDAVREFCNIVCGNVAARLAQQGLDVDIGPPETHAELPAADEGRRVVSYPIKVGEGAVDLRFLVPVVAAAQAPAGD